MHGAVKKCLKDNKQNSLHFAQKHVCSDNYLSLDNLSVLQSSVFLELHSGKTVHFSEQIMSADKYLSIFSCQMDAIVNIISISTNCLSMVSFNVIYNEKFGVI